MKDGWRDFFVFRVFFFWSSDCVKEGEMQLFSWREEWQLFVCQKWVSFYPRSSRVIVSRFQIDAVMFRFRQARTRWSKCKMKFWPFCMKRQLTSVCMWSQHWLGHCSFSMRSFAAMLGSYFKSCEGCDYCNNPIDLPFQSFISLCRSFCLL